MTTKLLAGTPDEIGSAPDVATCMRHVSALETLQQNLERIREVRIAALGKDYEAVAEGGELDSDVLQIIAEETAKGVLVGANLAEAKRALAVAIGREVKVKTIQSQDKAEAVASRLETLGVKMETAADELCRLLSLTWQLGQEAKVAFREVGRIDNTLTENGYIASSDITDLASAGNLQSMVERHMHATLGFWRSDTLMTTRANPRLAESLAGMAQSLRNTAGLLLDLGPDVTDGEKQAIRQFMAGETEPMPAATGAQGFFTH